MRILAHPVALVILGLTGPSLAGCSSAATGSGADASAEKACLDTAEAFARAAERCGSDYQQSHDTFLKNAANGDCKNVTSVRDEAALRSTCLPSIQTVSCADLTAGTLDPSCSKQLQRTASVTPTLAPEP